MYSLPLFAKDTVHELKDFPQSSVGAPVPIILSDEHHLHVIFRVQNTPEGWDGTTARLVGPESEEEPYAIASFSYPSAYYSGSPNDETLHGHPLHKKGLEHYGAYEVKNSSWIQILMKRNRVHSRHSDDFFANKRHFVLTFHDSMFECISEGYSISKGYGSMLEAAAKLLDTLK